LTAFLRGYLHEDFVSIHGTVTEAAAAFRDEASPEERAAVVEELSRLTRGAHLTVEAVARFLHELGGRWTPRSLEDITALAEMIRGRA
jgi:hypothetical protein